MYTNAKIRIYLAGIDLLKVNNENSRTRRNLFKVNKKRHRKDLIDMKTSRNIDAALVSLLLTLKRFPFFP